MFAVYKKILQLKTTFERCSQYLCEYTSVSNLARLQLVQNTLARVVTQKSRFCHITPVLADLHWLPVRHRISFKIATIAFKVLHFQQPSYLAALSQGMCPRDHCDLLLPCQYPFPREKLQWQCSSPAHPLPRTLGSWNKLLCHLSFIPALPAFRKRFKHHLFSSAFPGISSPSTDITPCDVITSMNVNHSRCTLPPS